MTQIFALNFSEKQGMELYEKSNINMSQKLYYQIKGRLKSLTKRRLEGIVEQLPEEHLKSSDLLYLLEQRLVGMTLDPNTSDKDKLRITKTIVDIQPYKTAYQEGAKYALQELEKRELQRKNYLPNFDN